MLAALLLAAAVLINIPANPDGGPVVEEARYEWINGVYQPIRIVTQDGKLLYREKLRTTDAMDSGGPIYDDWRNFDYREWIR